MEDLDDGGKEENSLRMICTTSLLAPCLGGASLGSWKDDLVNGYAARFGKEKPRWKCRLD